jgi:hypothetical protein
MLDACEWHNSQHQENAMPSIAAGPISPSELTTKILEERTILRRHREERAALRLRIAANEARFGIASSEIHRAIDDGRITETTEVCDWLIDVELLTRIEDAGR